MSVMMQQAQTEAEMPMVPAGYKQTEVGVIPEDWDALMLTEGINLVSGHHVMAEYYNSEGKGVPYLTGPADFPNGQIVISKFTVRPTSMCEYGDILITVKGSGAGTLIESDGFYCISRQLMSIKSHRWNNRFLKYSMLQNAERIKSAASGLIPGLSRSDILEQKLPIPSLLEQTAIANALSDVDALIGSLEALIAKKQAIKTATMQQLLTGRTRLPQFSRNPDGSPKGYKSSDLGEIPKDWEVQKIGTFTDCTAGGTPSTSISSYWGGSNPWMSSGELHLKRVFDVAGRITDLGLANSSTKYIPAESVLIGLAGQGKTRGTVAISKVALCTNQSVAAIFPSSNYHSEYLYYNLDSRYEELRDLSTGDGGRGGLNLTIIRNLALPLPDVEEQTAIATILSDMDEDIQSLEARLAKTRDLKQGMMQQLLTGKIRLPVEHSA